MIASQEKKLVVKLRCHKLSLKWLTVDIKMLDPSQTSVSLHDFSTSDSTKESVNSVHCVWLDRAETSLTPKCTQDNSSCRIVFINVALDKKIT